MARRLSTTKPLVLKYNAILKRSTLVKLGFVNIRLHGRRIIVVKLEDQVQVGFAYTV